MSVRVRDVDAYPGRDGRRELYRQSWCEWVRSVGVDPGDVPADFRVEVDDAAHTVKIPVAPRDDNDRLLLDRGGDVVWEPRVIRVDGPIPPFPDLP